MYQDADGVMLQYANMQMCRYAKKLIDTTGFINLH